MSTKPKEAKQELESIGMDVARGERERVGNEETGNGEVKNEKE